MARLGAWAGILLIALYVIVLGGAWDGIYTPALRVATMALTAILLAGWGAVAWRRPAWRPRSVLSPAIAVALFSLALSTVFSTDQRVSLEYLGYSVILFTLYLLLVRLMADPWFRARIIALASMLFVAFTVLYVALTVDLWTQWWSVLGHVAVPPLRPDFEGLTYGNPSAALTVVTLLAVPSLAHFARPGRGQVPVVIAVLVGVAVVALLSGSRAGWFALGLTTLAVAIVWLSRRDTRALLLERGRALTASTRGRVVALVAVLVVLAVAVLLGPPILIRVAAGGLETRLDFSVIALREFASAPVLGTGPGTWTVLRLAFTQPGESLEYVPYAHNLEVQTLSELGIVGVIAGLVVVGSILWLLSNGLRDPDATRRRWATVTAIGLLYFVLHQLLDFYGNLPAALIAAAIPVAYLDATATAEPRLAIPTLGVRTYPKRWLQALTIVLAIGSLVAVVGLIGQEGPAAEAQHAVDLANVGAWAEASAPAQEAAAADPVISSYVFTAGLTAAHAGDAATAANDFAQVADRDDYPEAWLDLAAEEAQLGNVAQADEDLHNAMHLASGEVAIAFAAADLALRIGDQALVLQGFDIAITSYPSLVADPWWSQDPGRMNALDTLRRGWATTGSPDLLWEMALVNGDPDLASLIPATSNPPFFTMVSAAWTGDANARTSLLATCDHSALDPPTLYWCARVSGHLGDTAGQQKWIAVAAVTPGATFEGGHEIRVATQAIDGRALAGSPGYFWGLYTYRRATPWDVLVPSLAHLSIDDQGSE